MGIIHILDSEISNKIAAGEVVERPSSVVKELVENSIDAKSTHITVEIKNGGATYIRVTDNGCGMSEEDAKICFLRHATSKIKSEEDLDAIYTLGFRGEAMSSIGAVANVTLNTKRREDNEGIKVSCKGGEIISSEIAGTPDGTSIVVEDLFYNTPARRKFLKKDATEAGYITDIITKFIFAHPEISFRFIVNDKEKLYSAGDNSLLNAVYTVYGKDYAKHMREVSYNDGNITVTGLTGTGNVSRPNRNYQSFFVNRRYIKSPLVIRAVEEAYKNQVMIGKFPVVILNIEVNAELIDINVHPTKLEVKFSNERDIYHTVYYGIKNALYEEANVPEVKREESFKRDNAKEQLYISDMVKDLPKKLETKEKKPLSVAEITKRPESTMYNPKENPFIEKTETQKSKIKTVFENQKIDIKEDVPKKNAYVPNGFSRLVAEPKKEEVIIMPQIKEESTFEIKEEKTENVFVDEYFTIIGQIFNTYIIAEKNDEMLIIDQHAAHERLKYEELKKDLQNKEIFSQMLIEPVIVNMTGEEYGAFDTHKEIFFEMGFECDDFGDNAVIIRSVPGETDLGETEDLFLSLVTEAMKSKKELITDKYQRLLYTIACKSAVKANWKMSTDEMKTLVRNVLRLKNINTCPHGRPIIITMSKKEIEKEFGRIV